MNMQRVESMVAEQARDLMARTGATLVMAGTKTTGGKDTGQPAVVVAVPKKVPLHELPPDAVIPSRLTGPGGSVATDVVTMPRPTARPRRNCPEVRDLGCDRAIARHRPLVGGISMFHARWPWCAEAAGTLGAVVRDAGDGRLVGLTNNHCLGLAYHPSYGRPWFGENDPSRVVVHQPAVPDTGHPERDRIGVAKRMVPLAFAEATRLDHPHGVPDEGFAVWPFPDVLATFPTAPANTVDGGLIALDAELEAAWGMLDITAGPLPFATRAEVVRGMPIYKAGRTTGRVPPALGTILSTSAASTISYGDVYSRLPGWEQDAVPRFVETLAAVFTGQMVFSAATADAVTNQPGDSGSVVLGLIGGQFKIIGLYFAGAGVGHGLFTPIWTVADALQIEAYTSVRAPAGAGPRWFFGVACQVTGNAPPAISQGAAEAAGEAAPPVTVEPLPTGAAVFPVRHRADVMQVVAEDNRLTHGASVIRLGVWPPVPGYKRHAACLTFEDLPIPAGVEVTAAALELTVSPQALHDRRLFNPQQDITLTLQASALGDAPRPRSFDDWSAAPGTTAAVAWSLPRDAAPGQVLTSPDLTDVVQEALSHPNWNPGSSLTLHCLDQTPLTPEEPALAASLLCCGLGTDTPLEQVPRLHLAWRTVDASFEFVQLCLNAPAALPVLDATGKAVTRYGDVAVDTAALPVPALRFDGSGDYLSVPQTDAFYPDAEFTVEAWLQFDTVPTSGASQTWCGVRNSGGAYTPWQLQLVDGKAQFLVANASNTNFSVLGSSVLAPNTLYHLAGVFTGTHLALYVNGVREGTASFSGTPRTLVSPLGIGRAGDNASRYFSGLLVALRITKGVTRYAGSAITPAPYPFPEA